MELEKFILNEASPTPPKKTNMICIHLSVILASKSMTTKLQSIEQQQQKKGSVRYQMEHIDLDIEREMK